MKSKTILVTGCSSGIGAAAAKILLEKGHTVYGAARRTERLGDLEKLNLRPLNMDVTNEVQMVAGIEQIIQETGGIDGLVNNAGYGEYGALEDMPLDSARYQFEVNVFGLARLTQLVLPYMRVQKAGRIVNVSSVGGRLGEPHGSWYHATKFAIEGLSDSLRMELSQFGIDVVVIQPGAIRTEWNTIARDKLIATSGSTAYGELASKHARMLEQVDKGNQSSAPKVVGQAIAQAILKKRPKSRYAVGGGARVILALRSLLSDRLFDKVILSTIGRA